MEKRIVSAWDKQVCNERIEKALLKYKTEIEGIKRSIEWKKSSMVSALISQIVITFIFFSFYVPTLLYPESIIFTIYAILMFFLIWVKMCLGAVYAVMDYYMNINKYRRNFFAGEVSLLDRYNYCAEQIAVLEEDRVKINNDVYEGDVTIYDPVYKSERVGDFVTDDYRDRLHIVEYLVIAVLFFIVVTVIIPPIVSIFFG